MAFLFERSMQSMLLRPPFAGKWPLLGLEPATIFRLPGKIHLSETLLLVWSWRRGVVPTSPTRHVLCVGLTLGPTVLSDSPGQKDRQR